MSHSNEITDPEFSKVQPAILPEVQALWDHAAAGTLTEQNHAQLWADAKAAQEAAGLLSAD